MNASVLGAGAASLRLCKGHGMGLLATRSMVFGAALAAIGLALAGCGTTRIPLPKSVTVKSQDQAGTVLVAATMVAPWDEVAPTLAPGFTLTGQTALTSVIPDTEQVSQSTLNATSASLGVGNPANAGTSAATAVPATGPTPGGLATGAPTSPPAAVANTSLGTDQALRYKAANELNESVQLLNAEVNYAAIRDCFVPYVVKLKLAFMPYVNPLAYSAHTQISFLKGDEPSASPAPLKSQNSQCAQTGSELPVVVPLLAADDLQAALNSRSAETARQIALAAAVASHGIGANANAANLYEALTAISNQELSSSLTVARTTNNGLYILIAPNNQASGQPMLVGQAYDVAVLLLIPHSYFVIGQDGTLKAPLTLVSYTKFRNAATGAILANRPLSAFSRQADAALEPFLTSDADRQTLERMDGGAKASILGPLITAVQRGDYANFETTLDSYGKIDPSTHRRTCPDQISAYGFCVPSAYDNALWAALISLTIDSGFSSADLQVRGPTAVYIPGQSVLVQDDQSGTVSVVLRNVEGASAATLTADLKLTAGSGANGKAGASVDLPAQSISLNPSTHTLTLTFASPIKAGLPGKSGMVTLASSGGGLINVSGLTCESSERLCPVVTGGTVTAALEVIDKPTLAPGFTLASTGPAIVIGANATGTLPLTFVGLGQKSNAASVTLAVSGASVSGLVGPAATKFTDKGYTISQDGAYTLTFANLVPGMTITVKSAGNAAATTGANAPPAPSFGDDTRTFTTIAGTSGAAPKGS